MNSSTVSKAIAGGLVTLVVSWLARYGVTLSPLVHDTVAAVALALVTYIAGHIVVYLSPKNKEVPPSVPPVQG